MKRIYLSIFCALLAFAIGTNSAGAANTVFESSLVTSEATVRALVELTEDGGTVGTLSDGESTIESGEIEIDRDGKVKLKLVLEATGTVFLLINQADTDGDSDLDFVFSGSVAISEGEVDVEFAEAIPAGTDVEDVVITILLDTGDQSGVLDVNDTILAVSGFTAQGEVEQQEFEIDGTVSSVSGNCPDVTFVVDDTSVTVDGNTEYENGSCDDLFGVDVQVNVEGVVVGGINLATDVEFLNGGPEGNEIHCVEGQPCEGTNEDDIIYGTSGPDEIDGGNGNDIIYGDGGDDLIAGGNGKDVIYGEDGDDTIRGGNGSDELYGGEGEDELRGGNGADILDGGLGVDRIRGELGPDTIYCDGEDEVNGGLGNNEFIGCEED